MQALILAGGSGSRFWPLSRRRRPKQLLPLVDGATLLRDTVDRLPGEVGAPGIWVCTTVELAAAVRQELPEVPPEQVLAEPEGRNTAPAIGWSLGVMPRELRDEVIAVLPADHRVRDPHAFRATLRQAAAAVERHGCVVALGVTPDRPETGYGYLELGPTIDGASGLARVRRFTEKPDAATAGRYLAGGRHLWNAGIFVFRGTTLLSLLERLAPEVAAGLARLAAEPARTAELYRTLPSISIDYAVMERLDDLAALPLDCGWSDLGSWAALADELAADRAGNRTRGDVLAVDAAANLLYADAGTIAVVGVEGLVVVRTADAVLVVPQERSQEVRRVVDALRRQGRGELL